MNTKYGVAQTQNLFLAAEQTHTFIPIDNRTWITRESLRKIAFVTAIYRLRSNALVLDCRRLRQVTLSVRGLDADPIVHRRLNSLLATEVSLDCLYRDVAEEELDLFEFSAGGLATVVGLRRTKASWQTSVDDMASSGATGTDEEFDAVVEYLGRYLGKVNVNTANSTELEEVLEISAKEADAVVKYHTANGAFKDFDALQKVPDVDAQKLIGRKDRIVFR